MYIEHNFNKNIILIGEPDFPTPANVKEAAKRAINEDRTGYTHHAGIKELREAVAGKLKRENNLLYNINNIITSNGAKHCLFNALQSLVNRGDEVIIPSPYWVSFPQMVKLAGGKPVIIRMEEKNGFKILPKQLIEAITNRTKAIILCNPSNPTGSVYKGEELESIADIAVKHNLYVIADEIYERLVYDEFQFVSIASLNEKIKNKTVVINGVSKAFAMTGWRIGYAAGPEEIIRAMSIIQSHSTSNPPTISQFAAIEALNGTQETIESMRNEYEKRRNYIYASITAIERVTCNKPQGAFYLFPNFSAFLGKSIKKQQINNSLDLAMLFLKEAKVAVVPGSSFGAEGFIRISFAASMEGLEEGVKRIKSLLLEIN